MKTTKRHNHEAHARKEKGNKYIDNEIKKKKNIVWRGTNKHRKKAVNISECRTM